MERPTTSAALLMMDLQNGVIERYGPEGQAVVERAATAGKSARACGVPVIYVRIAFRAGSPEISRRNLSFAPMAGANGFKDGDRATEIHDSLKPQPGDIVVLKKRVSAFTGSDLDVVLRSLEVTHLVLTGIATSGVVLSTLRQGADLDYRLTVLSDGCADSDEEVHRVLCEKLFPRQADVMTVADWTTSP